MSKSTDPTVRHDIVIYFDALDSNPNGDPDAGNRPRVDPETGQGLTTDVSIKRKVRDTVGLLADGQAGYDIFVTAGTALNSILEESYEETGLELGEKTKDASDAKKWLCERYFDLRMFGGVLSVGQTPALGQLRGPVQVSFARSLDAVTPTEHTITRVTHTKQKDVESKGGGTMGNKWTVPYGLYKATLSYSASRGVKTGVSEQDLDFLYRCLTHMFDHTSSAARPTMATRKLVVFSHSDAFGSAPQHVLFERVSARKKEGIDVPRAFSDYEISIDDAGLPAGVSLDVIV